MELNWEYGTLMLAIIQWDLYSSPSPLKAAPFQYRNIYIYVYIYIKGIYPKTMIMILATETHGYCIYLSIHLFIYLLYICIYISLLSTLRAWASSFPG